MNRPTFGTSMRTLLGSCVLWILAALSSCAASLHAVSAAIVVAGTYFTAWATRRQHELVSFFARYGASIDASGATPNVMETRDSFVAQEQAELSQSELELEQQGDAAVTSSTWSEAPAAEPAKTDESSGMFGTTPPRGQA